MRKLPDCPKCEDEILALEGYGAWLKLVCRECGWYHRFFPPPAEDELDAAIDAVLAEAVLAQGNGVTG
jgi:hypothetical protein